MLCVAWVEGELDVELRGGYNGQRFRHIQFGRDERCSNGKCDAAGYITQHRTYVRL